MMMQYAHVMAAKRDTHKSSLLIHDRRSQIARFFRERRIESGRSVEDVAGALGLPETSTLVAYEDGIEAIPLDMIFALTNLLNVPPEDTMNLIHDIHSDHGRP